MSTVNKEQEMNAQNEATICTNETVEEPNSTVVQNTEKDEVHLEGNTKENTEDKTSETGTHNTGTVQDNIFSNIGLDVVVYDRKFSRSQGTLSQIVKSLEDMSDRLSDPVNDYQKGLYPHIQTECLSTVQKYTELLNDIDSNDNYVVGFYLNGPRNNGKRKATTTPHERKNYGVSEYKETLKSINDRLRHIKIDCKRKCQDSTRNNHEVFQRMIKFCDDYHQTINDRLQEWDDFIADFRKANGVSREQRTNTKTNDDVNDKQRGRKYQKKEIVKGSKDSEDSGETKGVKSKRHLLAKKKISKFNKLPKSEDGTDQDRDTKSKRPYGQSRRVTVNN